MRRPQLFLLHFAGGNHYSFQRITSFLHDFEVIPLELPGRGERMQEDLLTEFGSAAADLFGQILQRLRTGVFFLYGHSMGAFLTLRIANMLAAADRHPLCLVVSGNCGPGIDRGPKRYRLPHDQFINELKKLGGVPNEVLENRELLDLFLPILRADFQVAEENHLEKEPPVNIPIFAIMGEDEEYVKDICNWRHFTYSSFDHKTLGGGHFFIFEHAKEVANIIRNCFNSAATLKR